MLWELYSLGLPFEYLPSQQRHSCVLEQQHQVGHGMPQMLWHRHHPTLQNDQRVGCCSNVANYYCPMTMMQLDGVMATRKAAVVPFVHYLMSGSYYRAWHRRCWHTVIYYRFPMIMAWFNLSLDLGMVCVCVFVAFAYRKSVRGSSCKSFMKI